MNNSEKTPVLHIEGAEQLQVLNHLLEEIPVRYRNQVDAIFQFLGNHTHLVDLEAKKPEQDEHHTE